MEFFNNKDNDFLKFKINSEGIDINKIEPRLVLTTKENKNYLFLGEIQNNVCKFNIPKLELFESGTQGNIKFEIISEDSYYSLWNDHFEVKTKSSIKIEEIYSQIKQEEEKKKPTIDAVFEGTEKNETPKEHQHPRRKESEKRSIDQQEDGIIDFNSFFKKK